MTVELAVPRPATESPSEFDEAWARRVPHAAIVEANPQMAPPAPAPPPQAGAPLLVREERRWPGRTLERQGSSSSALLIEALKQARAQPRPWDPNHHVCAGDVQNASLIPEKREYFDKPKVFDVESFAADLIGLRERPGNCWVANGGCRETIFAKRGRPTSGARPLRRAPEEDEWAKAVLRAERMAMQATERAAGHEESQQRPWDSRFGVENCEPRPLHRRPEQAQLKRSGSRPSSAQRRPSSCVGPRTSQGSGRLEAAYGRPMCR